MKVILVPAAIRMRIVLYVKCSRRLSAMQRSAEIHHCGIVLEAGCQVKLPVFSRLTPGHCKNEQVEPASRAKSVLLPERNRELRSEGSVANNVAWGWCRVRPARDPVCRHSCSLSPLHQ